MVKIIITKLFIIVFILLISANSALGNSLITTIFIPEGIVMASDSRATNFLNGKIIPTFTDTATKLFLLEKHKIGISVCGQGILMDFPISSHIEKFIEKELTADDDIITVTKKLLNYFKNISTSNEDISFHVAGYKKENKVSVPYVYYLKIKDNLIKRKNMYSDVSKNYGIIYSGKVDILESLLSSEVTFILWEEMTLQDAIDFSIHAIRTTIDTMRFQDRPKTVGGPIDVLLISSEEAKFIQKKEVQGELIKTGHF